MDGAEAMKVANCTAKRLKGRYAYELSKQELEDARSFKDLILLEFNDRQQSRAVMARAIYEAEHSQKSARRTAAYTLLLTEQLDRTCQLVESLEFMSGRWVCGLDGRYVQLRGVAARARRLQRQARRLWWLRIWLSLGRLLHSEPA